MLEEFKKFSMRGNVVDLAVGVIVNAAFGSIVTSLLVNDIIKPIIGAITGGLDFPNYYTALSAEVQAGQPAKSVALMRRPEEAAARCNDEHRAPSGTEMPIGGLNENE